MAVIDQGDYLDFRSRVGRAFSPSTPVTRQDVFAGRSEQLQKVLDVVSERGRHAIIYGDRGVGKTSLARVLSDIFSSEGDAFPYRTAYYTCVTDDSFDSIMRGLFRSVSISLARSGAGFRAQGTSEAATLLDLVGNSAMQPNHAAEVIEGVTAGGNPSLVLFVDEFDRPASDSTRVAMSDFIKICADQDLRVTMVFIGVGETVADVLASHGSIHRSIVEIHMPLMHRDELKQIVTKGVESAGMSVDDDFATRVAEFSLGLPHYTHLLAMNGARHAVERRRTNVTIDDLEHAVSRAIDDAQQSVRTSYHAAVSSNRATLYREVMLACARAPRDELGTFGAPDVREQLRLITRRDLDIPAFAHHLNDFSSTTPPRGGILVKRGVTRHFRYKFANPLMPPFVLMMAMTNEDGGEDARGAEVS